MYRCDARSRCSSVPSLMTRDRGSPSIHSLTITRSPNLMTCGMRKCGSPSNPLANFSCDRASRR